MSETQKTLLIGGGVVVGAFVLMKVIAPAPVMAKGSPSSNSSLVGVISNVASLGSGIINLFGKSSDGQVVNTEVQTTPITDAQTDAFTSGHFGADYSDL